MDQRHWLGTGSGRTRTLKALRCMISLGTLMMLFLGASWAWAARDAMGAPPEELRKRLPCAPQTGQQNLAEAPFIFIKDVISRVDGPRCSMYPTDTQFALEAARKHGMVVGLLFLVDRLFHEWSESKKAPLILIHGKERFYDPLDANDFWLPTCMGPGNPASYGSEQ